MTTTTAPTPTAYGVDVPTDPDATTRITKLGAARTRGLDKANTATEALYDAIREAVNAGHITESAAARAAGIDRMTVRKILGKR